MTAEHQPLPHRRETSKSYSVVIPVFNEEVWIHRCLGALAVAARRSSHLWRLDRVVVVDDGSTDRSSDVAASWAGDLPVEILNLATNQGRFAARRRGLEHVDSPVTLLLDSRVMLDPDALRVAAAEVACAGRGPVALNGHVVVSTRGNPYARFWNVITDELFGAYFHRPRRVTFGAEEFDRYPKGTGCFLVTTASMRRAIGAFDSLYKDDRHASDDTHLLRDIAAHEGITVDPVFRCTYFGRNRMIPFLRHAHHRGIHLPDGYLRPDSAYRSRVSLLIAALFIGPMVIGVVPSRRRLTGYAAGSLVGIFIGAGLLRRRPLADIASLGALGPLWSISYLSGVARGVLLALGRRP